MTDRQIVALFVLSGLVFVFGLGMLTGENHWNAQSWTPGSIVIACAPIPAVLALLGCVFEWVMER